MATRKKKPAAKGRGPKGKAQPKPVHSRTSKPKPKPSRIDVFVSEYLVDLNGRQAAIRAGYSPLSARQTASELLAMPKVKAKVDEAMAARIARTEVTQDRVLARLVAIAEADPNELVELRRVNCRYCWGKDNRYQRTAVEMRQARDDYEKALLEAGKDPNLIPELMDEFDPKGGIGFNANADPNNECEECFGKGVIDVNWKDTRDVSPQARMLFAGVKETKEGLEVKMHNQADALKLVGTHLGMFATRIKHANDPENPMPAGCGFALIPAKRDPDTYEPAGVAGERAEE